MSDSAIRRSLRKPLANQLAAITLPDSRFIGHLADTQINLNRSMSALPCSRQLTPNFQIDLYATRDCFKRVIGGILQTTNNRLNKLMKPPFQKVWVVRRSREPIALFWFQHESGPQGVEPSSIALTRS